MAFSNSGSSIFGAKPQGTSLFGTTQPSSSTTQTTGVFGQSNQQQPPFGQQAQQPQSTFGGTSLFGGNTSTSNAGTGTQPQTSIFGSGSTGTQGTQQPQTGSIFGGGSTPGTQQPQTGPFGSSTTNAPGLFGSTTTNAQQLTGSGLFGGSATNTQQPQTGLFGSSTTGTQQPQASIFGTGAASSSSGGLFSSNFFPGTQQQQQQQQPSAPSTVNPLQPQATLPSFSGGSIFGTKPQQQQQQQPTSSVGTNVILTKTTKFNDLPEDVRRELELLDSLIQGQIQISKDLHQRKLGEEPLKGYELIKGVHKDFVDSYTTLRHDWHFMRDLKAKVDRAVEDTIVATRIVDGFRNPQAGGATNAGYLKEHAGFPFEFFSRVTDQISARLSWYKTTIEQIERKLTSSSSQAQTPHSIAAALQAQHQTSLALASKTAALDSELQKIKAVYTQLWRQKTGSMRDPFDELDKNAAAELEFEALPLNGK